MGETIYKGAPSYDLMLQLQLGIRWSVGRITPERRVTLPQCCPPLPPRLRAGCRARNCAAPV